MLNTSPSPHSVSKQQAPAGPSRRSVKAVIVWSVIGVILALVTTISSLILPTGADSPQCRSVYMFPSYAHLKGLDTSHTKFATKYNLYLYREQGKDTIPNTTLGQGEFEGLDGIPVLFIPGNAGSSKQVRSIAAEAANVYHENKNIPGWKGKNMDFFTAHFNEDFTAFHGRTMLDQAEYLNDAIRFILSLYASQENAPKSVLIIGHSMGGVVSRVMLSLPNYVEGSVNTIITLAAPHAASPATFDGDIMRLYAATDKFWRGGFSESHKSSIAKQRLEDVTLISITGGLSDNVLPADYTTLAGLVPDTHGFTVYTTGIPGVWTPIDHLAIVWCDQLRKALVWTLFNALDPSAPSRTLKQKDRMAVFRRGLLSGFEEYAQQDFAHNDSHIQHLHMTIRDSRIIFEKRRKTWATGGSSYRLFPLQGINKPHLAFLSSSAPGQFSGDSPKSALLLCKMLEKTEASLEKGSTEFNCTDMSANVYPIPNPEFPSEDSSIGGPVEPYYAAAIPSSVLEGYSHVMFRPTPKSTTTRLFSVAITSTPASHLTFNASLPQLLLGSTMSLPPDHSLFTKFTYKNIWNSLLAYTLRIDVEGAKGIFPPFAKQSVETPMETKWHLNLNDSKHISFHAIAPFTPYETVIDPLEFTLWLPEYISVQITMKVDLLKSFKLLVLRYRLGAASMPIVVIVLTLLLQFYQFFETGTFPTFEDGLTSLSDKNVVIVSSLALLTALACWRPVQKLFYFLDLLALTDPTSLNGAHVNPYFLGLQDPSLWLLGPILYLISFAAVNILLLALRGALFAIPNALALVSSVSKPIVERWRDDNIAQNVQNVATGSLKNTRRLIGSLILLAFVMFYIPFQFAYVVACLVQAVTTARSHLTDLNHKEKVDTRKTNIANYNLSLLILMLWIIPVNAPVLVVFFHNIAVRWRTPFTSHHNILAILPILALVGRNTQGIGPQFPQMPLQKKVTYALLGYFVFYALIYGIRHLYWIHYLLNFFSAWLVMLSYWPKI